MHIRFFFFEMASCSVPIGYKVNKMIFYLSFPSTQTFKVLLVSSDIFVNSKIHRGFTLNDV